MSALAVSVAAIALMVLAIAVGALAIAYRRATALGASWSGFCEILMLGCIGGLLFAVLGVASFAMEPTLLLPVLPFAWTIWLQTRLFEIPALDSTIGQSDLYRLAA